jgi:hypothetical protein
VVIEFGVGDLPSQDLFLDFRGVSIANLTINGTASTRECNFKNHKVYLDHTLLKNNNNKVRNG